MNSIREKAEYILTQGFFSLLRICPASLLYGICRGFAALFYLLAIRRRKITLCNLELAFPDLPVKERKRIACRAFDHFGQFIAESTMILAGKLNRNQLMNMVDGSDMQKLLEMEARTEKGILFITGHLGNFELLAHYTGMQLKRHGQVVARKGSNRLIDEKIVTPMRESFGNSVIYKDRALPHIVRGLRKGNHIGLLIDIKIKARQGLPVQFFGHETFAINSSAYLQLKLNPLVVPMTMVRVAPRKYKLVVGNPIHWTDNGKPRKEQVAELTQIHQTELEKLIRAYPEQWLWMHDRWSQPELERARRKKRKALRIAAKEAS